MSVIFDIPEQSAQTIFVCEQKPEKFFQSPAKKEIL